MKLKIGPTRRFRAANTRGAAFHGMGAFVGDMTGGEMIANFETAYLPCLIRRETI